MRVFRKSTVALARASANGMRNRADQTSHSAGVPQVVLPMWADLYNYAQLAEQIGVGLWGCRETSPEWTPECLKDDILHVVASNASDSLQVKAKQISVEARKDGLGRDISAGIIAQLARSGY
jgi:UDP:flavonoid glycosyltransferase YjiC (YdhE family)